MKRGKQQCPRPDKVQYHSKKSALMALKNPYYRDRHFDYPPRAVYKCRCGFWHLSSQDKR